MARARRRMHFAADPAVGDAARAALIAEENWEAVLLATDGGAGADEELALACECGRPWCAERLLLTVADYRRAHARRAWAVVGPGHTDPVRADVVHRRRSFDVVARRPPS